MPNLSILPEYEYTFSYVQVYMYSHKFGIISSEIHQTFFRMDEKNNISMTWTYFIAWSFCKRIRHKFWNTLSAFSCTDISSRGFPAELGKHPESPEIRQGYIPWTNSSVSEGLNNLNFVNNQWLWLRKSHGHRYLSAVRPWNTYFCIVYCSVDKNLPIAGSNMVIWSEYFHLNVNQ